MKKILHIAASFILLAIAQSCSLDELPQTELVIDNTSRMSDLRGLRNGIYTKMIPAFSNEKSFYLDCSTDQYSELTTANLYGATFYGRTYGSDVFEIEIIWSRYYEVIAQANLTIEKADLLMPNVSSSDKKLLEAWKGEAYLARAIAYRHLALNFCKDYEPSTAASSYGVPIVTTFDITATPPGRGTLEQTYQQITSDIAAAEPLLAHTTPAANAKYLNKDCLTALKVQVHVDMHQYPEAVAEANKLIPSYPLAATSADLKKMWMEDLCSETIFQIALTPTDIDYTTSYKGLFNGEFDSSLNAYLTTAGFIPEKWVVNLYNKTKDLRYGVYISKEYVAVNSSNKCQAYVMKKFIGNINLGVSADVPSSATMVKLFRIADIILLKAEAEYRSNAASMLGTLNSLRVSRGLDPLLNDSNFFKELQDERVRELVGEGGRLNDLKRWGLGFTRDHQDQIDNPINFVSPQPVTSIEAGNNKLILPIPYREFEPNKNLKGQQNDGYTGK